VAADHFSWQEYWESTDEIRLQCDVQEAKLWMDGDCIDDATC